MFRGVFHGVCSVLPWRKSRDPLGTSQDQCGREPDPGYAASFSGKRARGNGSDSGASIGFAEECRIAGGNVVAEKQLEDDLHNLDMRYRVAYCLAFENRPEDVLGYFLAMVERDRQYNDAAKKK